MTTNNETTKLYVWDNCIFVLAKTIGEAREIASKRVAGNLSSLLVKLAESPVVHEYPKAVIVWGRSSHG